MIYTLGEPALELPAVVMTQIDEDCDSLVTELLYYSEEDGSIDLPESFTVTNDTDSGLISIVVQANSPSALPAGLHVIQVLEKDTFTGFTKTSEF